MDPCLASFGRYDYMYPDGPKRSPDENARSSSSVRWSRVDCRVDDDSMSQVQQGLVSGESQAQALSTHEQVGVGRIHISMFGLQLYGHRPWAMRKKSASA